MYYTGNYKAIKLSVMRMDGLIDGPSRAVPI